MISDELIQIEFDKTLKYFREYFSDKDRGGIAAFFMGGDSLLGSYEVGLGESRHDQRALYLARIRAIAQALSEHPTADAYADSISTLRKMGATDTPMA